MVNKWVVHILLECILVLKLITTSKGSLGQGNVFTPVCLFTGEGVCLRGKFASRRHMPRGGGSASRGRGSASGGTPGTRKPGGAHPNGMLSCYVYFWHKINFELSLFAGFAVVYTLYCWMKGNWTNWWGSNIDTKIEQRKVFFSQDYQIYLK